MLRSDRPPFNNWRPSSGEQHHAAFAKRHIPRNAIAACPFPRRVIRTGDTFGHRSEIFGYLFGYQRFGSHAVTKSMFFVLVGYRLATAKQAP